MSMDFASGNELYQLCREHGAAISEVMLKREMELGSVSEQSVRERLVRSLQIMEAAVHEPLGQPRRSLSGLIGGEAWEGHRQAPQAPCRRQDPRRRKNRKAVGDPRGRTLARGRPRHHGRVQELAQAQGSVRRLSRYDAHVRRAADKALVFLLYAHRRGQRHKGVGLPALALDFCVIIIPRVSPLPPS